MSTTPEARKLEEAEFHDKFRGLYETDPERYGYYTSNKKFYSVVKSSDDFYYDWFRVNAFGMRVLDIGCGNGIATTEIARFAEHVTGIDISPETVRIAAEHARSLGFESRTTFTVMDAENLAVEPGSFDVVSVRGVLHHMDLDVTLAQINKVLKPDGKAIFLEALANNPIIHAYRKRTPHLRTAWEADHILRFEDAAKMRKYFNRVEVRPFHLLVLGAVPLRKTPLFKPALKVLDRLDRALLRLPGVRKQGWMAAFMLSDPIVQTKPALPKQARVTAQDDVLMICVNYRKPAETARFVTSALQQSLRSPLRVVVVDNSPTPQASMNDPNVRILAAGKNLGYFGAAAAALSDHLKSHPLPDWVIVSNPDVYLPDHSVLQRLCDSHRGDEPAVIAPSIRTLDSGSDQNPYMRRRPSRLRMHMYSWIYSAYPVDFTFQGLAWIKHRVLDGLSKLPPAGNATQPEKIYAPHGSFIALHRSYFERGGTLEFGAFLFGEEIFIGETARRLGLNVLYEPSVVIEHTERNMASTMWNRDRFRYRRQASRYLARTFF